MFRASQRSFYLRMIFKYSLHKMHPLSSHSEHTVKSLFKLTRAQIRKDEWGNVGLQRNPIDQIRRGLHDILTAEGAGYVKGILAIGIGRLGQAGHRARR